MISKYECLILNEYKRWCIWATWRNLAPLMPFKTLFHKATATFFLCTCSVFLLCTHTFFSVSFLFLFFFLLKKVFSYYYFDGLLVLSFKNVIIITRKDFDFVYFFILFTT
jgi:hypothetical protein